MSDVDEENIVFYRFSVAFCYLMGTAGYGY
jgi:hypothetical protein